MPNRSPLMLGVFALTLFVSATLLFLVQPMIGKMMLPLLGGSPAVWNTCMVFFQAVLLAGYAYSHASAAWLGVRRQAMLQVVLLILPLLQVLFIGMTVSRDLLPSGEANPIPFVLLILLLSVGLPFFVVSTTAPLLQKWFAGTGHAAAADPYFLYGASNLGSMLALAVYPAIVEPWLRLADQTRWWAVGYAVLAGLTVVCAYQLWQSPPEAAEVVDRSSKDAAGKIDAGINWGQRLHWVALAFVPSSLMLGATTYITTDIAAIPLLWVLPLAIYLLSFIIIFSQTAGVIFEKVLLVLWVVALLAYPALYAYGKYLTRAEDTQQAGEAIIQAITLGRFTHYIIGGLVLAALAAIAFIVFFGWWSTGWYRQAMLLALPVVVMLLLFLMVSELKPRIWLAILLHLLVLFVVTMVCHGELARRRPSARHLTEFYLLMSLGGVLGGLFNALVAPMAFLAIWEYPLALVLACLLMPPPEPEPGQPKPADKNTVLKQMLDLAIPLFMVALCMFLILELPKNISLQRLATRWNLSVVQLWDIIMYGIPAVICYAFVDRPVRFGLCVLAFWGASTWAAQRQTDAIYQDRSFFGVLSVREQVYDETDPDPGAVYHRLVHGTTLHGRQKRTWGLRTKASVVTPLAATDPFSAAAYLFAGEDFWREPLSEPLTYYHRHGPIGQVMQLFAAPSHNIAVIGLGTGSMAAYAKPGQRFTYYEIDKHVLDLASNPKLFTYLTDAKNRGAKLDVVMGDARLEIERKKLAPDELYHVIAVDAFSSDAIPVHLITLQAVEKLFDKVAPGGVVAYHISNRYLDLEPVLANIAEKKGYAILARNDVDDEVTGKAGSTWVLLARKKEDFGKLVDDSRWEEPHPNPKVGVWTDDFSNVLSVFSWKN